MDGHASAEPAAENVRLLTALTLELRRGDQLRWFRRLRPRTDPALRLVCLPYAGGGSGAFRTWPDCLPHWVEVCAVILPGREERFREPPIEDLRNLVEALAEALLPLLDRSFAVFGHSMGALIGFELVRCLRRQQAPVPAVLFVSGASAPNMRALGPAIHQLPEDAFLRELARLNGTPPELLQNRELMRLLLPTLRADFKLHDEYVYTPDAPLGCPIVACGGRHDPDVTEGQLRGWQDQTGVAFSMRMFHGDHFFLQTARRQVLRAVGEDLARALNRRTGFSRKKRPQSP